METLFTGIKPTGNMHIGNYIGAIYNGLQISKGRNSFFCVVDLHALTVDWDSKLLEKMSLEITILYLSAGFNMENCSFFVQSANSDHPYLGWIFNCITPMGLMKRMTQYKEKSAGKKESVTVGLFDYPLLMAADILLYDTDVVPVGEDQVQHVELAREVAKKFNSTFGTTFKLPKAVLNEKGYRVRSLQHPDKKMSKSDDDSSGCIYLLDNPDEAVKKIKRAVTDSGSEIGYDWELRPGISNLIDLYSILGNVEINEIVEKYRGLGYSNFKNDLSEIIRQFLITYQREYYDLKSKPEYIKEVLDKGLKNALDVSNKKVELIKERIGFMRDLNSIQ